LTTAAKNDVSCAVTGLHRLQAHSRREDRLMNMFFRRSFLWLLAAAAALVALPAAAQPAPAAAAPDEFRVTLLGTGSPAPVMRRFGPGVLVEAGGKKLLIDCGRGVTQRLLQAGVRLGAVDALFITTCIQTTSSAFPTCG
jgi:hypothetical protein